jgi:hypothetical protein
LQVPGSEALLSSHTPSSFGCTLAGGVMQVCLNHVAQAFCYAVSNQQTSGAITHLLKSHT